MKRNYSKGFTLGELLVVIAIVVALVAISVPMTTGLISKGREAACLANLRNIGAGLQLYLNDNAGVLPVLALGKPSRNAEVDVIETVLLSYLKDEDLFDCPADSVEFAKTGSSYGWNVTQNGLKMSEVDFFGEDGQPDLVPLVFDKEAWHDENTNFLYADASVSRDVRFVSGGR